MLLLLPLAANADAVEIDGIFYNLVSRTKVAEVTSNPNQYTGDVVIPETVTYNGTEYSVTSIGTSAFSSCSSLTSVTIGCGIGTIGSIAFANCQNLTDVYCHAERVPSTSADVFENSNIENAALHVPTASISAYKAAEPWKNFKNIVALDGSTPETQKCATPTISYENGRLTFDCETDDVEFIYNVVPAPGVSGKGNDVEIKSMFTVSVYATKTGYENSEVATKEISIEGGSGLKGDVNGDGEVGIGDIISITNIMSIRP